VKKNKPGTVSRETVRLKLYQATERPQLPVQPGIAPLKRKECSLTTPDSLTDRPLGWTANTNAPVPPLPFTNRLISHPIRPEIPLTAKIGRPIQKKKKSQRKKH
jgi:hypothetical protein